MRIIDEKQEIWPYILASILVHLLLLLFIPHAIIPAKFDEKPVEVYAVSPVEEKAVEKSASRIADIPKPAVEQRPDSAKFLGMYDSTVTQEQVGLSRKQGEGGQGGKFKTKIGGPVEKQSPAQKPAPEKSSAQKPAKPRLSSGDRLYAFNKDIFEEKPQQQSEQRQRKAVEDADNPAPGSQGALDDFYPDYRRGEHTYLNVLRYPGVEYFVRMKRAFKVAFNPEPALRDFFSHNLMKRGSVDVVLGVSVGRDGNLSELFIFRSSGIPAYDEESLRTVRVSSPFESPPDKFLSKDGQLRMTWTFTVYL